MGTDSGTGGLEWLGGEGERESNIKVFAGNLDPWDIHVNTYGPDTLIASKRHSPKFTQAKIETRKWNSGEFAHAKMEMRKWIHETLGLHVDTCQRRQ